MSYKILSASLLALTLSTACTSRLDTHAILSRYGDVLCTTTVETLQRYCEERRVNEPHPNP